MTYITVTIVDQRLKEMGVLLSDDDNDDSTMSTPSGAPVDDDSSANESDVSRMKRMAEGHQRDVTPAQQRRRAWSPSALDPGTCLVLTLLPNRMSNGLKVPDIMHMDMYSYALGVLLSTSTCFKAASY